MTLGSFPSVSFDVPLDLAALRKRVAATRGRLSLLVQWMLYAAVKSLSRFWERDDDLWVFGARGGDAFVDNAKYLYLHVAAERPEVRPVWLTKSRTVARELRAEGYEAYHCYSPRGLRLNLRAGVVVLTQGHRDVAMACCGGARSVVLWHGVPLKKISWDAGFRDEPLLVRLVHRSMADEFDLLTVPGEPLVEPFASGLRIPPERMAVVGYPRTDALFADVPGVELGTDARALDRLRRLSRSHELLFYLPTFRDDGSSVADHLDFRALDALLSRRDAFLVAKTHPNERLDLPPGLSRVVHLPEKTDVYPFLRYADLLVTDYSSVYFDFLIRDRPVVFYPYDLDRYRRTRGFYFDYAAVTPGPVVREFPALLAAIERALDSADSSGSAGSAGSAKYAARRREIRESLLGGATGGDQSAAVYEAIRRHLLADA